MFQEELLAKNCIFIPAFVCPGWTGCILQLLPVNTTKLYKPPKEWKELTFKYEFEFGIVILITDIIQTKIMLSAIVR